MKKETTYFIIQDIELENDHPDFEETERTEKQLRKNFDEIDPRIYDRLDRVWYSPSASHELYDYHTDTFYNMGGEWVAITFVKNLKK